MATHSISRVASAPITERRERERLQVHWPLTLIRRDGAGIVQTVTENLSSNGFYCFLNEMFVPGEEIEAHIQIPARHDRSERQSFLICRVRVVRVETGTPQGYGLGCQIEDYCVTSS